MPSPPPACLHIYLNLLDLIIPPWPILYLACWIMKIISSVNSSCSTARLNPLRSPSPATRVVPVVGIWMQQSFWRICFPRKKPHDHGTTLMGVGSLIKSTYGKCCLSYARAHPSFDKLPLKSHKHFAFYGIFASVQESLFFSPQRLAFW